MTYAYDAEYRIISRTDRNSRRIDYAFDALGRDAGETWYDADGTTVNNIVTRTYDSDNRIETASDSNGTYTFTYDALGRVASVNDVWNNLQTFTYDALNRRTTVEDSAGGITTSVYNAIDQLTSRQFSDGTTELRIDFVYDEKGRTTHESRYSDLAGSTLVATTDTAYNINGQITNRTHADATPTVISSITFTYDSKKRLSTQNTDGTIVTYTYDSSDQVTADGNTTVTYDETGNRNNDDYETGAGNQLTTDGTWNYTYDYEGNQTKKVRISDGVTWKYGYDNKNHLTSVRRETTDGGTLEMEALYKYDILGNRIEKNVDSTITRFAYDGWNPAKPGAIGTENFDIWADFTSGGSLTTRYFRSDKVDEVLARINGTTPRWYLTDHQGSIRTIIDNTGTVKDAITYNAFGEILSETDAGERGRYAWTGREIDVEIAMQFNRARYYDPVTARWVTQDPLGYDAGDSNLYRYVHNTPTMATDPSGLDRYLFRSSQSPMHSYVVVDNWSQDRKTGLWRKDGAIKIDFSMHYPSPAEYKAAPTLSAIWLAVNAAAAFTVGSSAKVTIESDVDPARQIQKAIGIIGNGLTQNPSLFAVAIEQASVLNGALQKDTLLKTRKTSPAEDLGSLREMLKQFSRSRVIYLGTTYHALLNNCNDYSNRIYESKKTESFNVNVAQMPFGMVISIMNELGPNCRSGDITRYLRGLVRPPIYDQAN